METSSALLELASVSLACRDQDTLLKTFAARVGAALGARAVLIWLNKAGEEAAEEGEEGRAGLVCRTRWSEPGERFAPADGAVSEGFLAELYESAKTRRLAAREIEAEELEHLDEASRARVKSAVYAPLPGAQASEGVVEVLNKRAGEFSAEDAQFLEEAGRLAGQALTNLEAIEGERQAQLATLERLTSLYDLGRTFTSTLELSELLPVVAGKIRDILAAGACNLWLLDPKSEELVRSQQAGEDPTAGEDARASATEGLLGEVAQQAAPKLVEDPAEEEGLQERRKAGGEEFEIQTWMAAPLRKDDEVLGVVELVNKQDGSAYDENDLFFLSSISEQAAVALHNANLLESERKVYALDALLKISQEITSTLDLDHVLTTVVAQASEVVPFDKCVIGFFDRGRFVLGAVSGETEVPKTREMDELRERLEWLASQQGYVSADLFDDGWHVQPDEARAQLASYLEKYGQNGFYALPLRDDQGTLGAMALLSGDADFLTQSNQETMAILANQTTVAIRNAQLYQQVPLANLLQPFAARKKKLMAAVPKGRWRIYIERAAIIGLLLVAVPFPMRVGTDATVVPAERRLVSTIDGGVIKQVFVHEGDPVQAGQVLAQLDNGEDRMKLAQASAALAQARHDLAEAEFRNDPSAAGQAQLSADLHAAEVQYEQQRIDEAQLRAPMAGVVVSSKIEEKVGTLLKPGDAFAEIVEHDRMAAEMSVPEADLALVETLLTQARSGNEVSLKLNAFPTDVFQGTVQRLGAQTQSEAGEQYFLVRAVFQNPGGRAHTGMVGRARIRAGGGWFKSGWYPVGYVLLRSPARMLWEKIWSWVPFA